MSFIVAFSASAARDLDSIDDYISADNPDRALAFIKRIEARCFPLADFPNTGRIREELGPDIRVIGFERRVAIIYRVSDGQVVVL